MSDFVLGKYVHKNTPIHNLDPRIKVFGMILIMVGTLLSYGTFISTFIFQSFFQIIREFGEEIQTGLFFHFINANGKKL